MGSPAAGGGGPAGTIVAMGGGGFTMEPDNPLLDRYVLSLSGKARPRVCLIPTAGGDSEDYVRRFHEAFRAFPCEPGHLSLFRPPPGDLEAFLLGFDVLYVGGGNTRSMLALWREWGLDRALRAAWERGVVLAGVSAGMICWFEEGVTDSVPGTLGPLAGLGFLEGSACPHYDGEPARRPAYRRLVGEGRMKAGYAADDGVALRFEGGRLVEIVSSRPAARAWRVAPREGRATEVEIEPSFLGGA